SLQILDALPDDENSAIPYTHAGGYYRVKGDLLATTGPDGLFQPTTASVTWYQSALNLFQHGVRIDHAYNEGVRHKELARGKAASEIPNQGWADLYEQMGVVYSRLRDFRQGLQAFLYALSLRPSSPSLYQEVAVTYSSLGDDRQAAIALIAGLTINPND